MGLATLSSRPDSPRWPAADSHPERSARGDAAVSDPFDPRDLDRLLDETEQVLRDYRATRHTARARAEASRLRTALARLRAAIPRSAAGTDLTVLVLGTVAGVYRTIALALLGDAVLPRYRGSLKGAHTEKKPTRHRSRNREIRATAKGLSSALSVTAKARRLMPRFRLSERHLRRLLAPKKK